MLKLRVLGSMPARVILTALLLIRGWEVTAVAATLDIKATPIFIQAAQVLLLFFIFTSNLKHYLFYAFYQLIYYSLDSIIKLQILLFN